MRFPPPAALVPLALLSLAAAAPAQLCGPGESFFKNDDLPQIPSTSATVSVIPGLCEGEAIGAVIDVSSLGASALIQSASVAYVNAAGAGGIQAEANLQIYDGISWSSGLPTLGTKVFDFNLDTGSSVGLTSSGINQVSLASFQPAITSGTAVVVWEMLSNPLGGNCTSGYQTNFATDHTGGPGGCTPPQKNLIRISGQGWRDVTTATVSGFPLCPLFVASDWIVRICAEGGAPSGPVSYCTAGASAAGCVATLSSSGSASASSGAGFLMLATGVEGAKDGLFFYGQNGRQANPWGSGTSFQCVVPPVARGGLLSGSGNPGTCTGAFVQDLNARWCPACPKPAQAPAPGTRLQLQFWYRDPASTSNQTTSLSDAHEVDVAPR
jgi:hypothetical protein